MTLADWSDQETKSTYLLPVRNTVQRLGTGLGYSDGHKNSNQTVPGSKQTSIIILIVDKRCQTEANQGDLEGQLTQKPSLV